MSVNANESDFVPATEANQSSQLTDIAPLEFILMRRYIMMHLFSDKEYEHFSRLRPEFETTLFSQPLGMDEHPIYGWFVRILDEFWRQWPIEEDPLLFEPEFEEEKTRRSKEIVSMFVMALEQRWSNPALRPEGEAGTVERMFALMWYLHDLIDDLFPTLKEASPAAEDLENTPGLVEVHWM